MKFSFVIKMNLSSLLENVYFLCSLFFLLRIKNYFALLKHFNRKKKKSNLLPWAKFLTYLNKLIGKLKDFWEREETKETLSFLHSCSTAPDPFSSAANNRQTQSIVVPTEKKNLISRILVHLWLFVLLLELCHLAS